MLVVLAVITNMCRTGKSLPCDALLALVESRRTGRLAGRSIPLRIMAIGHMEQVSVSYVPLLNLDSSYWIAYDSVT